MTAHRLRTAGAILAIALGLGGGLSACGSTGPVATPVAATPDASLGTFGPACSLIPSAGAGSFNGMANAPVAAAASANPLLKTLVDLLSKAGMEDTLNASDSLTLFAPTDDAFAKLTAGQLNAITSDKVALVEMLQHHVVVGRISPARLIGTHRTLAGDTITVSGSGTDYTVSGARVLCGNVKTSNATVYVIDSVLPAHQTEHRN